MSYYPYLPLVIVYNMALAVGFFSERNQVQSVDSGILFLLLFLAALATCILLSNSCFGLLKDKYKYRPPEIVYSL